MTQRPRRTPPERRAARDSRQGSSRRPAQGRGNAQPRRPGQVGRRPNPNAQRRRPAQGRRKPVRRRRDLKWLLAIPVAALVVWFVLTHYVFLDRKSVV